MAPLLRATPNCCICGKPLSLEHCKFDEVSQPVHQGCHLAKLLLDRGDRFPFLPSRYKTSALSRPRACSESGLAFGGLLFRFDFRPTSALCRRDLPPSGDR
jgi:hypothetical protein